jgi:hypothetical protein
MRTKICVVLVLAVLCGVSQGTASKLEDELKADLVGSWIVMTTDVYSDCSGFYTNNDIQGTRVTSKSPRRFEPGEVGKIDKINLKRSRIDVFVRLGEPILQSRVEGPFELFDELHCKAQLQVELGRPVVKSGNRTAVLEVLAQAFEIHTTRTSSTDSSCWNGRRRRPLPEDYEQTLAEYEIWKAEQLALAVAKARENAIEDAAIIVQRVGTDPDYLDGFAAGFDEIRRGWTEDDCDDLVGADFDWIKDSPPSDQSRAWKDGYRDGQELAFNVLLAYRLAECVPTPVAAQRW